MREKLTLVIKNWSFDLHLIWKIQDQSSKIVEINNSKNFYQTEIYLSSLFFESDVKFPSRKNTTRKKPIVSLTNQRVNRFTTNSVNFHLSLYVRIRFSNSDSKFNKEILAKIQWSPWCVTHWVCQLFNSLSVCLSVMSRIIRFGIYTNSITVNVYK